MAPTRRLCLDNCQWNNKKKSQQMFHSRDGKPGGDDNQGKPRNVAAKSTFALPCFLAMGLQIC